MKTMKAVALIQFYFDYVLPRGGDWEGRSLRFSQDEGWHVIVRPRRINEALFPNEIDQTLSTMHFVLARLNTPTGQTAVRVIERCHDRVEVQVWRDVSGVQTVQRPEMQEEFLRSAIQACNTFLNHCRVVAQAPFVHGVEQQYRLQDGRYHILMPYTITWLDGTNNERLPVYPENVNASASPGAVPAPERGFVDFAKIIDALKVGPEPKIDSLAKTRFEEVPAL